MSIIVYGPKGCGKTRNSVALMKAFGMTHICDGYDLCYAVALKREAFKAGKVLYLTSMSPPPDLSMDQDRRVIEFSRAMDMLGARK